MACQDTGKAWGYGRLLRLDNLACAGSRIVQGSVSRSYSEDRVDTDRVNESRDGIKQDGNIASVCHGPMSAVFVNNDET